MVRIISILSGKGGVGKTVVAINLATALHKWFDKKVLLVDCNLTTAHIGMYLGMYSTPATLNHVLSDMIPVDNAIYSHESGLDILPASLPLKDLKNIRPRKLRTKLKKVFKQYDFIILDSAPGFGREGLMALEASDETLFVTTPIAHSAADLIKCRELAEKLGIEVLGIIMNMVKRRNYELSESQMSYLTDLEIIGSVPYNERITESVVSKNPAVLSNNIFNYSLNKSFKSLAKKLVGEEANQSFSNKFLSFFENLLITPKDVRELTKK